MSTLFLCNGIVGCLAILTIVTVDIVLLFALLHINPRDED